MFKTRTRLILFLLSFWNSRCLLRNMEIDLQLGNLIVNCLLLKLDRKLRKMFVFVTLVLLDLQSVKVLCRMECSTLLHSTASKLFVTCRTTSCCFHVLPGKLPSVAFVLVEIFARGRWRCVRDVSETVSSLYRLLCFAWRRVKMLLDEERRQPNKKTWTMLRLTIWRTLTCGYALSDWAKSRN